MKKLISAAVVKQAHADKKKQLDVPKSTSIITPEARTLAEKLGVELVEHGREASRVQKTVIGNPDEKLVELITQKVMGRFPCGKQDQSRIRKIVRDVLAGR
ncbi:MAG: hypothetical protein AB7T22_13730 [Calditrichaceae bacterium]